jgi:hypothetical protein
MKHKEALEKLEKIVNNIYLPEVCERFMMNHHRLRVELHENVSYHMSVTEGMPCVIKLNIQEKGDEINTLLNDALHRIRKGRLDQPFPLVPKEYYKDANTPNKKWGVRRLQDSDTRKGQQSVMVDVLPKVDITYKCVTIREVTDKITGLTVRVEESCEDIKDMPVSLWVKLSENVREFEDAQDVVEIKNMLNDKSDTPELDKAMVSENASN